VDLVWSWLTDPAQWQGSDGVPARIVEHLTYSAAALAIAAVVAVPAGLWVGHTGRGKVLVVNTAGTLRAIPSLGLLFVAVLVLGPRLQGDAAFYAPTLLVLAVLAVPPIMAGAYAGVAQVDPAARDAARGMGMTGREVLFKVEVPCAMPLLISGFRSAALQVVATATLAATVGLGGLGRYLIDGLSVRDYGQMAGGAVVIALLALAVDGLVAVVQRLVVSRGLATREQRRPRSVTSAATLDRDVAVRPTTSM
jgi:osmoprotectant transport system permease protein